jgi:hypothetical protein
MTENELELLNIIRTQDNPEEALKIAIHTIIDFLELPESSQVPFVVCSPALA